MADNSNKVRNQLQQMDMIYQQATVTIIAAAGTNAHYGLPGVNESYRKPASPVRVHNERLYAIPKPERRFDNCRWITRAWTYQEGLLSTRRLIFTDEQLYFECNGCYCAEMIQISLDSFKKLHAPDKPYFHRRYRGEGSRMGTFPLNGYGVGPWDIYTRIHEYSERSLSHDSDILNGILGIFRAFEKIQNPMRHLYGIPFPKATACPNQVKKFDNSDQILPTFSESLQWKLEVPSKRRQGFPSWSWTGWYGRIIWPALFTVVKIVRKSSKMERPRNPEETERALDLSVELLNGNEMKWTEFQENYELLLASNALGGFISIEANATPVSLIPGVTDSGPQSPQFRLNLAEGTHPILASITTVEDLQPHDTFLAIHFHRTVKGDQGRSGKSATASDTQHLLIVQQLGSHWERVAIGSYVIDSKNEVPSTRQRIRLG
ncbi:uncharacterized protein N0V89_000530 [Didymosphaeria variabile]|uniref:Heterokaryon incompatibility domain-containing protein n=1 Tax=Didymosphaeria variabile TaxID=1932322 RepID=A0A9W8XVD5_9PLEO|nr:uncharacterized protein N0V89_000530 [Didymosphaeria variabile]KAJ4359971.1 hypothetical protein N0V89_000530 [Didymosphaeria variabile]